MYAPRDTPRQRLTQQIVERLRWYVVQSEHVAHAFAGRHGLHPTDMTALIAIMDAEGSGHPLTPGGLATRLRLSSAATTSVIDRLERGGHVRRSREDADRRRVHLRYGERGMAVAMSFFGPLGTRTDAIMDQFDDAELAVVHRFLTAMAGLMEDYRATVEPGAHPAATPTAATPSAATPPGGPPPFG